ncbi:MAG: TIGR01906 family membrane protein [Lachnospirales bacterium]
MNKVLGVICGICIFFVMLYVSVCIPALTLGYYEKSFEKNNVVEDIKVNKDDLMKVTKVLTDYMKDERDDLEVIVTVNGTSREFFNEKEKLHMVDVKDLLLNGRMLKNISLVVLTICVLFFVFKYKKIPRGFLSASAITIVGITILLLILGLLVSTNFNKYFIIFHEIFFSNDLWILEPGVDLLINLVPLQFFISISVFIVALLGFFMATYVFLVRFLIKKLRLKKNIR